MSNLYCNSFNCWPNATSPCPTSIFAASVGTTIPVVSGGTEIPLSTFIPDSSTTVPTGTVTVITPLLNITSFQGNITATNGFFTVPTNGQYLVTAVGCFSNTGIISSPVPGDYVALYLYKVNHYSQPQGLVTLEAQVTAVPIAPGQTAHTCLNLAYIVDLKAHDRVFVAARQLTQTGDTTTIDLSANTRVAIRRAMLKFGNCVCLISAMPQSQYAMSS